MRTWLLLIPLAFAHQPTNLDSGVFVPEDPTISYAVNGTFHTGDEVFEIPLTFEAGFALPFELLVEKRPENEDHRPMYAVVGPGLPLPTEEERALLPRPLEEGEGAFVDPNDTPERLVIFESVMRRFYWSSDTTALPLPAGTHTILIWCPGGTTGDFVMGFGVEEDFSEGFGGLFEEWSTYAY